MAPHASPHRLCVPSVTLTTSPTFAAPHLVSPYYVLHCLSPADTPRPGHAHIPYTRSQCRLLPHTSRKAGIDMYVLRMESEYTTHPAARPRRYWASVTTVRNAGSRPGAETMRGCWAADTITTSLGPTLWLDGYSVRLGIVGPWNWGLRSI